MQAGRQELTRLCRQDLQRMQNELLRASGWPAEVRIQPPAPEPPTKKHDEKPPKPDHLWAWFLGATTGLVILAIFLASIGGGAKTANPAAASPVADSQPSTPERVEKAIGIVNATR